MIDRKLLKVINFILLIIRILNIFYFETASNHLEKNINTTPQPPIILTSGSITTPNFVLTSDWIFL